MATTVRWFDLSRFGARLVVMPDSVLRGTALTCLEVYDRHLFTATWGLVGSQVQDAPRIKERRDHIRSLGFGPWHESYAESIDVVDDRGVAQPHTRMVVRYTSERREFSLRDIQGMAPGFLPRDVREMPVEEILVRHARTPDMPQAWEEFARDVLGKEAMGVWTPKVNPFDQPWDHSDLLEDHRKALHESESGYMSLFSRGALGNSRILAEAIGIAGFRTNALVPFYVDEHAAIADGWLPSQIEQVDLPYALPLYVTHTGQIQALKDVRYAPELMHVDPEHYFGQVGERGLAVRALRTAKRVAGIVREQMESWLAWAEDPASLQSADDLWKSFNEVGFAHAHLNSMCFSLGARLRLRDLADSQAAEFHDKPFRARPLGEMNDYSMDDVAVLCARYLGLDEAARYALQGKLIKLLARGHELLADKAQELAEQKLRELGQTMSEQEANAGDGAEKVRHEDAGVKIGGARKDYARQAMGLDDLATMNDAERELYVIKNNIWAPLDYAQMRDDGVSPEAAMAMKVIKDRLPTAPVIDRRDSEYVATYITAISMVRDSFDGVKTTDEFIKACKELFEQGNADIDGKPTSTVYGMPLQVQWGEAVSDNFLTASYGRMPHLAWQAIDRRMRTPGRELTDEVKWGALIKTKKSKSPEQLARERERAEIRRLLSRPRLDKVERVGEDWRAGRDIVADDLLEHFGFRAVEFGNWLPQDERQTVLNMAFDSLCDLASALSLPPKALSCNGKLAVAFGARGKGGSGAGLAHYEPARTVINLTRMKGAGALAHEWMHALDHHLHGGNDFHSESASLGTPMGKLSHRLCERAASHKEILESSISHAQTGMSYARSWLHGQPQEVRDKMLDVLQAEYERLEAIQYDEARATIERVARADGYDRAFGPQGAVPARRSDELAEDVYMVMSRHCTQKKAMARVKSKVLINLKYMARNLARVASVRAAQDLKLALPARFFTQENSRASDFLRAAKLLDTRRSKKYWATTCELFARAGEAYVYDKIAQREGRSDYLVFGVEEDRHASHPYGNPYPAGDDRTELSELFDALIDDYRLKCIEEVEPEAIAQPG